jgi:alpha-2-macroglobulin
VNALGGFDFAFTIPQQVNLGYANVRFWAEGRSANLIGLEYWHGFQIQEFRRPEFEVNARPETLAPILRVNMLSSRSKRNITLAIL